MDNSSSQVLIKDKLKNILKNRKIIFVLFGLGFTLVLFIVMIFIILLVSLNNNKGEDNINTTPTPTKFPILGPTTTPTISAIPSVAPTKTIDNPITFNFSAPKYIKTVQLFTKKTTDDIGSVDYKIYEAGNVDYGKLEKDPNVDLSGYKYYLAIKTDFSYPQGPDPVGPGDIFRFISNNSNLNKIYFLDTNIYFDELQSYVSINYQYQSVSDYIDLNTFYDIQLDYQHLTKSDNNNLYYGGYEVPILASEIDYKKVDSINGTPINIRNKSDEDLTFMITKDGLVYRINYMPGLLSNTEGEIKNESVPKITWSNNEVNKTEYDYISIGSCGVPNYYSSGLEVVDISVSNLTKIGTDNEGNFVYEMKGSDSFVEKVYYEDYISQEYYKYNSLTADDTTPFTFDEYKKAHPVFYWEDPFGRIIKFASRDFVMTGGCAKPIVYLYPEKEETINVTLNVKGVLTLTVPTYKNGWEVIAKPNGELTDLYTGKCYDYLWWESRSDYLLQIPKQGFVIGKSDLETFFNSTLKKYNLNDKEITDFKDYWLPIMNREDEEYFYITFLVNDQVNQIAELQFDKDVDTLIRVFMMYKPVNENYDVQPLEIKSIPRNGFTVIEWGGSKIK